MLSAASLFSCCEYLCYVSDLKIYRISFLFPLFSRYTSLLFPTVMQSSLCIKNNFLFSCYIEYQMYLSLLTFCLKSEFSTFVRNRNGTAFCSAVSSFLPVFCHGVSGQSKFVPSPYFAVLFG
ncbi:hypothetical protein CRENBAI_006145 [Crenichthys baileyi]|uniref:Uncharacterized protein n=1 Tax=Crenichthys baileyi TaxID=28760 RepID=A0AAV9R566_9TELE